MAQIVALQGVKPRHDILSNIVDRDDGFQMSPPEARPTKVLKRKLPSKIVLEEDSYVDALSQIIERDYFPDTAKLRRHLELLNAHDSNNIAAISALHRQILTDQRRSQSTPFTQSNQREADNESYSGADDSDGSSVPIDGLTVDSFCREYTSEDNESFERLHEKDLEKWRKARHWAYESTGDDEGNYEKRPGMLMLYHIGGKVMTVQERGRFDALLELPEAVGNGRSNNLDTWRFRVRNNLMFPPDRTDRVDVQINGLEDVPAIRDDSIAALTICGDDRNHSSSSSNQVKSTTNRWIGSNIRQEKVIQRGNTSLKTRPDAPSFSYPSGITPSPLEPPHTPSIQSDSMSESFNERDGRSRGSKDKREYRTISMTPSPMPGGTGESPLMTWGCIGGTPIILDPSERERGGNPNPAHLDSASYVRSLLSGALGPEERYSGVMYQPPPVQQRDLLAHALSAKEKARKAAATSTGGASSSSQSASHSSRRRTDSAPSSRHSQQRRHQLTPAAMSLAAKLSGGNSGHNSLSCDALSQSYTAGGTGLPSGSSRSHRHSRGHTDRGTDRGHDSQRGPGASARTHHTEGMNTDNLLNV